MSDQLKIPGSDGWAGRWLTPDEPVRPGEWTCFRGTFDVDALVDVPTLRVACDSKYWLWLDGRLVVYEGQLKRGPTPTGTYFDIIRLAGRLASGRHTLAVLVWFFGRHGFSHNDSGRCGLVLELRDATDRVHAASGPAWRAKRHPSYSPGGDPRPNFRLPESNVVFDARVEPCGWTAAAFDDSTWPAALDAGRPPVSPWGPLFPRRTPLLADHGVADLPLPAAAHAEGRRTVVCPLPFNLHAHPFFEITADHAGLTVGVRTDNYTGGGAANVRAEYVTRAGRQTYESFGWMNGHALHFDLPAGVSVHRLGYRRTAYDTPWTGSFESDCPRVNALYAKSRNTLDVCMRDSYMDCPDRERAQWWGDVVIQMGSAFYACDADLAPRLGRKAIDELIGWQRADGTLYSPVPAGVPRSGREDVDRLAGCWDAELPAQMLASVGWYGLWTYYLYSGDADAIAASYPAVRTYLALWRQDSRSGLVDHRAGGWDWVDWGSNVDAAVSINAWYALAVRAAANMAKLVGRPADEQAEYRHAYDLLKRNFARAFWKGDHFRADDALPVPDDRAQAMAVLAGFVGPQHRRGVLDVLLAHRNAGPYMEKYVIEALFVLDEADRAVARLLDRYAEQIDADTSTLWEGWSVGDATWGGGTYNHAWSGGAITLLQQYVAGVAPVRPGFSRFAVTPRLGPLRRVRSLVPTMHGPIGVDIDVDQALTRLEVPRGCTAEFAFAGRSALLPAGTHVLTHAGPMPVAG